MGWGELDGVLYCLQFNHLLSHSPSGQELLLQAKLGLNGGHLRAFPLLPVFLYPPHLIWCQEFWG